MREEVGPFVVREASEQQQHMIGAAAPPARARRFRAKYEALLPEGGRGRGRGRRRREAGMGRGGHNSWRREEPVLHLRLCSPTVLHEMEGIGDGY